MVDTFFQKRRQPARYKNLLPALTEKDLIDLEFIIEQKWTGWHFHLYESKRYYRS